MSQSVTTLEFNPGDRYEGKINGELFTVKSVERFGQKTASGACKAEYPVVYFVHEKTGKVIEYGLEAAKRLLFVRIP